MHKVVRAICIFLGLAGGGLAVAQNIGVMLGGISASAADASSIEKLCIVESVQERSGVTFHIYENHRSRIGSVTAAQKMVEDGVELALLPLISDEAIAAISVLREAHIPYLTSATSDSVIKTPKDGLSLFPRNNDQAEALAQFYLERYPSRPLAVITDASSAYSKQLSAQFMSQLKIMNASVAVTEHNVVGDSLVKLPDLSGYVVFAALLNPKIALLYRQLRDDGNVILIGPDSIGARKEFIEIVGPTNDNNGTRMIFLKNWDGEVRGEYKDDFWAVFYQGCNKQSQPTFVNAYVYDMVSLAAEWGRSRDTENPLAVLAKSQRSSIFDGQPIRFSENGYRRKSYFFYEYLGGDEIHPIPSSLNISQSD
ncbi:ABC transporter substrate-binding protein [Gynuella sunshinyii]|uniref:ABC-type branched-chain amino acid transport system, periplasmic component n=1 Tax=Gynuella sunshinyii YC6258 TaxID=1445510 RepID=A0A0C5VTM6_9GAMM|nr:ABC transporter substrate-binding protein [Gynuella sunshinyii]AJQ97536.1 ABC-type branched-chain amino acid transport system, periplasmic component [Gynuella sunshinyii YC6258]